jgi:hypothetical protein
MPTFLDIILYDEYIFKNKVEKKYNLNKKITHEITQKNKCNLNQKIIQENKFEENKKIILDSFINYPRLELIKKYKIQSYQFLMNKNYRNTFLKFLIIPVTFELCYNILKNYK